MTVRDRRLGDEWRDWDGAPEENGGDLATPPRVFLEILGLIVALMLLVLGLATYLVEPRLAELGRTAPKVLLLASGASGLAFLLWYAWVLLGVHFGWRGPVGRPAAVINSFLVPWAFRLARLGGIGADRVRNSLIRVQNRLTALGPPGGSGNILVLVPRCLSRTARRQVQGVADRYGLALHTADGGSQARRLVAQVRPAAIVAVACERDLLAGMQDVAARIPVLGVANRRPHGPCKATELDLGEFEAALRHFAGEVPPRRPPDR
ncbi:MAG: DUF116 domain-containing protein [Thermaerobacter sp.]|jgi:hypothetical protein|nr:DUF116 domain-containing protein [Thermaerobacter sp.]